MTEWQMVLALVVLVGLIGTIITPIIKLNTNIVKLTDAVNALREAHDKMDMTNTEEHKQLHERINRRKKENEELDDRVSDHENRISILEHK